MKIRIIRNNFDEYSRKVSERCYESVVSNIIEKFERNHDIQYFQGYHDLDDPLLKYYMYRYGIDKGYTWPKNKSEERYFGDIKLKHYGESNWIKRASCALSHFALWTQCLASQEPMIILEHDAIAIQKFDPYWIIDRDDISCGRYAIALNSPLRKNKTDIPVTPLAEKYHEYIQNEDNQDGGVTYDVPSLRYLQLNGLPGNSAYIIDSVMASQCIKHVYNHGLWPNDAILSQELMNQKLCCVINYVFEVQANKSTIND